MQCLLPYCPEQWGNAPHPPQNRHPAAPPPQRLLLLTENDSKDSGSGVTQV
ncbi:hypothetical protein PAL_GLEAN10012202 [Pteropus alecto]|uniref:Uncharacterized protein n=1 Tax=Pteropus alecto TaxID=9402 RepID=L5KB93_PTEAL|nr:hypothetical protein PAL_GLEAN10012202 [Pteropus alecto]